MRSRSARRGAALRLHIFINLSLTVRQPSYIRRPRAARRGFRPLLLWKKKTPNKLVREGGLLSDRQEIYGGEGSAAGGAE